MGKLCSFAQGIDVLVYDSLCGQRADRSTYAVGHHHKQTLGTRAHRRIGLLVNIERTGDIEEVKRKAVNDATQYEQQYAGHTRIAHAEEGKAQYPCQHSQQHDVLDTELLEEERDQKDADCLTNLRDRNEHRTMLYGKGLYEVGTCREATQEGRCKTVGDLQADTQEHTEDEEQCHLFLLEQSKSFQSKCFYQVYLALHFLDLAIGQRECICSQQKAQSTANSKLMGCRLETKQVDAPLHGDKSYRTEYTDRREVLDGIHTGFHQCVEGYRIGQCDRRHVEGYGYGVERKERTELYRITGTQTVNARCTHKQTCHQMTETQGLLGRQPTVGHDTHQCGHEDRYDSLDRVEDTDMCTHTVLGQVTTHTNQVRAPYGELQEVHDNQSKLKRFVFHNDIKFNFFS